jgi:5-methylcytosine-specific restriction endonuclease McrA
MHDWKCAHCGRPGLLTVDHKIPLSRGGSNWPSNLQPLCFRCNVVKNDKVEGAA